MSTKAIERAARFVVIVLGLWAMAWLIVATTKESDHAA